MGNTVCVTHTSENRQQPHFITLCYRKEKLSGSRMLLMSSAHPARWQWLNPYHVTHTGFCLVGILTLKQMKVGWNSLLSCYLLNNKLIPNIAESVCVGNSEETAATHQQHCGCCREAVIEVQSECSDSVVRPTVKTLQMRLNTYMPGYKHRKILYLFSNIILFSLCLFPLPPFLSCPKSSTAERQCHLKPFSRLGEPN